MFIVIEGIDGAGCETQAKNVAQKLKAKLIKYPDYTNPIGKILKDFLYNNQKQSPQQQFLLYSLQFVLDAQKIQAYSLQTTHYSPDNILIADRYFTTALCYQTLEGVSEQKALRFASDFGIVRPNLVFFLDVKPKIAFQRKHGENKTLNFREKDLSFMQKTHTRYHDLLKRNVWSKWIRIDGEREAGIITEEICQKIYPSKKRSSS